MKKILVFMMVMNIILLSSCGDTKITGYIGVNAEILEISKEVKGIVVKGFDSDSILGEACYINCEDPETYFIYVSNNSGRVDEIKFEDLQVGDNITVDIESVENKYALTSRVQLITQRR